MTLLAGVLCSNGAVIAADRQALHGAMGQMIVGRVLRPIYCGSSKSFQGASKQGAANGWTCGAINRHP
jgi:hypothetical protein